MNSVRIEPIGEGALLVRFGERIDPAVNARALGAAQALSMAGLPGVSDIAPAYASVCVRYDPCAWNDPASTQSPHARIASRISVIVDNMTMTTAPTQASAIEIPVSYGGAFGPDLDAVASHAGLSADEVIARHCAGDYRVAMLGFAPGFAYLLGLDPALHAPRRANPRVRVPGGSVAIGGAQTGIYPRELPGGWLLIGRTPLTLFDAARSRPATLEPGQRVRFRAIAPGEFAMMAT